MDDILLLKQLLTNLKICCNILYNATIESSTCELRECFQTALVKMLEEQKNIYKILEEKNVYPYDEVVNPLLAHTKATLASIICKPTCNDATRTK